LQEIRQPSLRAKSFTDIVYEDEEEAGDTLENEDDLEVSLRSLQILKESNQVCHWEWDPAIGTESKSTEGIRIAQEWIEFADILASY
jgi:hypothetical protein